MSDRPWCIRPAPDEYAPFYAGYIARVPEDDVLAALESQIESTLALLRGVPEARGDYRYAAGKWSIRQVVGHLIDAERVFAYRALRFARSDATPLAGFAEDDYVREAPFDGCRLADLAQELEHLRRADLLLFRQLQAVAWERSGTASQNRVSVRALARIIVGHERHHLLTLRERYLEGLGG